MLYIRVYLEIRYLRWGKFELPRISRSKSKNCFSMVSVEGMKKGVNTFSISGYAFSYAVRRGMITNRKWFVL